MKNTFPPEFGIRMESRKERNFDWHEEEEMRVTAGLGAVWEGGGEPQIFLRTIGKIRKS